MIRTSHALINSLTVAGVGCLGFAGLIFLSCVGGGGLAQISTFIIPALSGLVLLGIARIINNQNIIINKLYEEKEGEQDDV